MVCVVSIRVEMRSGCRPFRKFGDVQSCEKTAHPTHLPPTSNHHDIGVRRSTSWIRYYHTMKTATSYFIVLSSAAPCLVSSWTLVKNNRCCPRDACATHFDASTPFEADLYLDDDDDETSSLLAAPPDTRLVLGVNKYSHDTALCAAHAETGQVLFAMSKERLTRRKHDAGNLALLTEACLDALELNLENIDRVIVNNHHHRVLPMEANRRHMEWECGLTINGGMEDGYDDDENLFPDIAQMELSHHLAHAYSAAAQAPFDKGLVVVMDGMGETYRTMKQAVEQDDASYVSDLSFGEESFACVPSNIAELAKTSRFDWREAESVYRFSKDNGATMEKR